MKTETLIKGAIGLVAATVLFGIVFVGSALSFRSGCIRAEAGIKAQYTQNQNNYDNFWKKVKEMAQVPAMYAEDLQKLYDGAIKGRYGAGGSQAVLQFIKEHNPQLDGRLYLQLQAAIEAGRNGFAADQQQLIDKKRQYEVALGSTTALWANVLFNFPRIDLDQYGIVTSEQTDEAFRAKKSTELRLR